MERDTELKHMIIPTIVASPGEINKVKISGIKIMALMKTPGSEGRNIETIAKLDQKKVNQYLEIQVTVIPTIHKYFARIYI